MIDFTKPIQTMDGLPARLVAEIKTSSAYRFLVIVDSIDEESTGLYDEEGQSDNGDHELENIPQIATRVFARVLRSEDGEFTFDETVYETAAEAAEADTDEMVLIGVYEVDTTKRATPIVDARGNVTPFVAGQETDGSSSGEAPASLQVGYRTIKPGDKVNVTRRGYGTRTATVVKLRRYPSNKQAFVQCDDGTGPYWALNRNVS